VLKDSSEMNNYDQLNGVSDCVTYYNAVFKRAFFVH